jgi:hypothetical protein
MKCIQAIREGKYSKIGDIKRVDDTDAQEKVTSGYWKFIPKSEWKLATRKPVEAVNDQITDSVTVSEKQLKRKKSK